MLAGIATPVLRIVLTWILTQAAKKLLHKRVKTKEVAPYVAWIMSALIHLFGWKLGVTDMNPAMIAVDGGMANSLHSLTRPLRKLFNRR